jgi:hypothetical protein
MMKSRVRKTIIVNSQLKKMPKRRPKQDNAKTSHMIPNLMPTTCSIADASDERRTLIALELFSGRSK